MVTIFAEEEENFGASMDCCDTISSYVEWYYRKHVISCSDDSEVASIFRRYDEAL